MSNKSLIRKEKFNKILQYRESLQSELRHYKEALKCEHTYGDIIFNSQRCWTEVTCPKCGEGYATTMSGDGSCMSNEHLTQENTRKKTEEEIEHFRKNLNEEIENKIKYVEYALCKMHILVLRRRLFRKPRLSILSFNHSVLETDCDPYNNNISIDGGTKRGNKYFFFVGNFLFENGIISSTKSNEWTDIKNE